MKLTVNDLSYSYTKDVPVLKGVSFSAEKGASGSRCPRCGG